MLTGERILITGPAGQIAEPLVRFLAPDNEVWGIARFSDAEARRRIESYGVTTRAVDLGSGEFGDLPTDFTYVIHLAADQSAGHDYDAAIRTNAEGTGLLLQHCRSAKAALVMSTFSVYRPKADPTSPYAESDPLGEANLAHAPTYSMSKIAQEAVARFCAQAFDLPVVIARMNASYGDNGGLPANHLAAALAGRPVVTRWDPCVYSPIHEDDICAQTSTLLGAASVPATIVNWAGDEPVSVQEWSAVIAAELGRSVDVEVGDFPDTQHSAISDNTKRLAITGPCTVAWRDGIRRMVAPGREACVGRAYLLAQAVAGVAWWIAVAAWFESRLRVRATALGHGPALVAGLGLFAAGSALGLWSCLTMALVGHGTPLPMATARDLVIAGPYRMVRNPMAVAGVAQTAGVGLALGAWTAVAAAVAGAVAWDVVIRPGEEADLRARFGPSYDRYCADVRCWIPR